MGREGAGLFLSPGLSLVRPFAMAGGALVIMESLNEYAAAVQFGVPTLTTAMFRTWTHAFDLEAALLAVALERYSRLRRRFHSSRKSHQGAGMTLPMGPSGRWWLSALFILAILPGLLVPVFQCLWWLGIHNHTLWGPSFQALLGTLILAAGAGTVAILSALVAITAGHRGQAKPRGTGAISFAALFNYAMPGLALALGVLALAASNKALMVQGGMLFLFYALSVRFFSITHSGLYSAWNHRVLPYREAALVSGASSGRVCWNIYLPLFKPALLSALLLLVLDLSKELTVTLMLRPIGFSSLATLIYEQASQELPHLAAVPGLLTIAFTASLCAFL